MKINHCWKLSLGVLFLGQLVGATAAIELQQKEHKESMRPATNKSACSNSERPKFSIRCKDRYFLGESPVVTISITNTTGRAQTVKEAEHQKFSFEMTGIFQNDSGEYKKSFVYDGSWDIPKEPTRFPAEGEMHIWQSPRKREPKFAKLAGGESTNLELDLAKLLRSYFGVGKYKMTVKSEDGQKVVKEFEVYFDEEKTVPILAKMLASDSDNATDRNRAALHLARFNRPKLVSVLEELLKSGNEKQRDFAAEILFKIKSGWFDALKIKIESKDRFAIGENPTVAISIENGTSTPKTVRDAQDQKFLLELRRVSPTDSKQESKTCVYTPKDSQEKPKLVTLGEFKSTTSILNLSECFGARLDAGKYELLVNAADQEELKYQTAVRKFEVF